MTRNGLLGAALFLVLVVSACGGGSEPAKSAAPAEYATPSSSTAPAPSESHDATQTPQTAQPSNGGAGQFAQPPGAKAGAVSQLNQAEAQVQSSLGDCATACRALASMENAAVHICELDQGGGDCASARQRVNAARERVMRACGGCR
jgi:hypothetical protein